MTQLNRRKWIRHSGTVCASLLYLACGAGMTAASEKKIESIEKAAFDGSLLGKGQEVDLQHHRSEGLGLVPAPDLQAHLQTLLDRLAQHSPISGIPARVHILATEDAQAFATSDANIYVSLGLLRSVESEDEVAFILGHELAHLMADHNASDAFKRMQAQAVALTELGIVVHANVQSARKKPLNSRVGDLAEVAEQRNALRVNTMFVSPTWTRGQESDADQIGVDLAGLAGYAPRAALTVMQRLETVEEDRTQLSVDGLKEEFVKGGWFDASTWVDAALTDESAAKPAAGETPAANGGAWGWAGKVLGDGLPSMDQVKNRLTNKAEEGAKTAVVNVKDSIMSDHPTAKERKADLSEYLDAEYVSATQAPTEASWQAVVTKPETAEIFKHYNLAFNVEGYLEQGKPELAEKMAKASLSGGTSNHAYPAYFASLLQEQRGDLEKAIESLESGFVSPEPAMKLWVRKARLLERMGKRDEGLAVLETLDARFDSPPALYPEVIGMMVRGGNKDGALIKRMDCRTRVPDYGELCDRAYMAPGV